MCFCAWECRGQVVNLQVFACNADRSIPSLLRNFLGTGDGLVSVPEPRQRCMCCSNAMKKERNKNKTFLSQQRPVVGSPPKVVSVSADCNAVARSQALSSPRRFIRLILCDNGPRSVTMATTDQHSCIVAYRLFGAGATSRISLAPRTLSPPRYVV